MEQDGTSSSRGYTTKSSTQGLGEPIGQLDLGLQQENASIHTVEEPKKWFEGVTIVEWPGYSAKPSPLENTWAFLKTCLTENHPHLLTLDPDPNALEELAAAIMQEWEAIPQDIIDNCRRVVEGREELEVDAEV